jgi:hypothetical protein
MVDHEDGAATSPPAPLLQLWVAARTSEIAAAAIASRRETAADPRFLTAATHCAEAADQLQSAYPQISKWAAAEDLASDAANLTSAAATEQVLTAIADSVAGFDIYFPDLPAADLLVAATAANSLALAYHAISGRLP